MKSFVLWLVMILPLIEGQDQDYCYATMASPYTYFSTDTAYEKVHGTDSSEVVIPQCEPLQFWLLSRHGTRYPDEDVIVDMWTLPDLRDKIIKNHDKDQTGRLCAQDLNNLRIWTPQTVTSLAEELAPQGYEDLYNMAKRFQSRFPSLLNQSYSADKFKVQFTTKQRTALSAFGFLDGLFGTTSHVNFPQPIKEDLLIRPYKNCKKWQDDVDENPDTLEESKKFEDGAYMQTVIASVSQRLGFVDDKLTQDDINLMYDACRFEKAWHLNEVSAWCSVFSQSELEIMEYRDDLIYYYNTGYGIKMNQEVGCPPVKDFLDRFSDIENGKDQPAGVLYFSHASMLQLVIGSLGIFKDSEDLTHSNYETMKNRKWRTSLITPFAINIAAVFYKCDSGAPYQAQFYINENPLTLVGCNDSLCDWSIIKENYGSISDDCNLDFC